MPGLIDVKKSREFAAAIIAVRMLDRTIRKMVRQHVKAVIAPAWSEAVMRAASTALERVVIGRTATVAVSDNNVRVQSAGKGRPLSGGLNPKTDYPAVEFGAEDDTQTYNRRSKRGGTHKVTRHTARQLRRRAKGGHVFFPTAARMIPRLGSMFVQTIVKTIALALEGKQE